MTEPRGITDFAVASRYAMGLVNIYNDHGASAASMIYSYDRGFLAGASIERLPIRKLLVSLIIEHVERSMFWSQKQTIEIAGQIVDILQPDISVKSIYLTDEE